MPKKECLKTTSPYFQQKPKGEKKRKKRRSPSTASSSSSSNYFVNSSSSSAWGSANILGPLLKCLAALPNQHLNDDDGHDDDDDDGDAHQQHQSTVSSGGKGRRRRRRIPDIVYCHFGMCQEFQKRWHNNAAMAASAAAAVSASRKDNVVYGENVVQRLLNMSVRHLCPYRCYMRAFAPYRNMLTLRKRALLENDEDYYGDEQQQQQSVDEQLLQGWRCQLVPPPTPEWFEDDSVVVSEDNTDRTTNDNNKYNNSRLIIRRDRDPYLPSTVFINPIDGGQFSNCSQVLIHIRKTTTSRQLEQSSSNKRSMKLNKDDDSPSPTNTSSLSLYPFNIEKRTGLFVESSADKDSLMIRKNSTAADVYYSFLPSPLSTSREIGIVETPYGLLEELFCENPWQLLLSTIFLNRTSRLQVDTVLYEFLLRWPTALDVVNAPDNAIVDEISTLIRPMGMNQKRALGIVRFSKEYLELIARKEGREHDREDDEAPDNSKEENGVESTSAKTAFCLSRDVILSLHGCGEYAYAAYQLFIQRNYTDIVSCDHALQAYSEYQKGRIRACAIKNNAKNNKVTI